MSQQDLTADMLTRIRNAVRNHAPAVDRGGMHAARIVAHGGSHQRRMGLLIGLDDLAHAEFGIGMLGEADVPVFSRDIIGRARGPELQHNIDALAGHLAPHLEVGDAEHLESLTRPPGETPITRRPSQRWSRSAACAATCAGWRCGRFTTPVQSLMFLVRAIRLARNMNGQDTGSESVV